MCIQPCIFVLCENKPEQNRNTHDTNQTKPTKNKTHTNHSTNAATFIVYGDDRFDINDDADSKFYCYFIQLIPVFCAILCCDFRWVSASKQTTKHSHENGNNNNYKIDICKLKRKKK